MPRGEDMKVDFEFGISNFGFISDFFYRDCGQVRGIQNSKLKIQNSTQRAAQ
jgi:hypothetical protein